MTNKAFIHIDVDSPKRYLDYWGLGDGSNSEYQVKKLDAFYEIAIERVLLFFKQHGILATFFCVGKDLENSDVARQFIKRASYDGHEIANHTYSHPHGFSKLTTQEMTFEIETCSNIIKDIIGVKPVGFRAPGFDISGQQMQILKSLGFSYDSSAFWTSLNPMLKIYHALLSKRKVHAGFGENSMHTPCLPYFPNEKDWRRKESAGFFMELPLPRSSFFQLPFYNNFHLWAGDFYRKWDIALMNQRHLVYLFHLIEFYDLKDSIPGTLKIHPNIGMKKEDKIRRMSDSILRISKNYKIVRTDSYLETLRKKTLVA